jgi:hypothetical protein
MLADICCSTECWPTSAVRQNAGRHLLFDRMQADTLPQMEACGRQWCSYQAEIMGDGLDGLNETNLIKKNVGNRLL